MGECAGYVLRIYGKLGDHFGLLDTHASYLQCLAREHDKFSSISRADREIIQ